LTNHQKVAVARRPEQAYFSPRPIHPESVAMIVRSSAIAIIGSLILLAMAIAASRGSL